MRILFHGDSITDCFRDRNDIHSLGSGYPKIVAKRLKDTFPDVEFEFINKAIGGEETVHLRKRWHEDAIDLQPDIITLLCGLNDSWHRMEEQNWEPDEVYLDNYRYLLNRMKTRTNSKILVLEHYLLDVPELQVIRTDVERKIRLDRIAAREYADDFIPLDGLFAKACIHNAPCVLTLEGVHPTNRGHELIAEHCFKSLKLMVESLL